MTFVDQGNRQDPSQPLTLDRPQADRNLPPPYPQSRALPPALYIPNRPDRGPDAWGGDDYKIQAATMYPGMPSNPDMPSGLESYPTLAKSAGYLSKWGSDNINQQAGLVSNLAMGFAPLLDMLSKGAFSRNFNASSLNSIKVQQARLILESDRLQQRHAQELSDYGAIIAKADAVSKDPKATDQERARAIEDARDELRFLADAKYGHGPLVAVIDSGGGLDRVRQFLSEEDAYFRDAWAGGTALKKAAGVNEDVKTAEEWGEPRPTGAGAGGGIFGRPFDSGAAPEEGAPRAPDTSAGGDFNAALARNMKLSPQEMRAVQEEVAGGKPTAGIEALKGGKETGLDHDIRRKVGLGVDASNAEIDRIADDSRLTPEQKIGAIGKVNPSVASTISGLADYRLNPREEGVVNRQRLAQLTGKVFKEYNQANFERANQFTDTRSVLNKELTRTTDLVQNWTTLLTALKRIGENKSIPRQQIEAWLAGHGTGDPEYDIVYSQIRNIATQINSIQTLTGTPRVTMVHDIVANLQKDASPRSIRAQLLPDIQDSFAIVNSYQDQWEGFGKKSLMPAISPSTYKDYRAIVRMNPFTGEVPDDSSLELKAAGADPSKASSRLTPQQKMPPLTLDKIRNLKGQISRFEHDPDPDKRQQAQEARELIGPVRNIDRRIPGVDEDINAARP